MHWLRSASSSSAGRSVKGGPVQTDCASNSGCTNGPRSIAAAAPGHGRRIAAHLLAPAGERALMAWPGAQRYRAHQ